MDETKCWTCRRAGTGQCSWDKRLEPVDGWTAEARRLRLSKECYCLTYHVSACPMYVEERRERQSAKSGRPVKTDLTQLEQLVLAGVRTELIALELGVGKSTVRRYRKKILEGEP